MIVAIAFDDTLAKYDPADQFGIGEAIEPTVALVHRLQKHGHILILWTCREGEALSNAETWCRHRGIFFDAINENYISPRAATLKWPNSRKIYADLYIDDKAINAQAAGLIYGI